MVVGSIMKMKRVTATLECRTIHVTNVSNFSAMIVTMGAMILPTHFMLCTCIQCHGEYCDDCVTMTRCAECAMYVCDTCSTKCPNCEDRACSACKEEFILTCGLCKEKSCGNCIRFLTCEGDDCNRVQCETCWSLKKENNVEPCEICNRDFCPDCRYNDLRKDWRNACGGCIKVIADVLGKKLHEDSKSECQKCRH